MKHSSVDDPAPGRGRGAFSAEVVFYRRLGAVLLLAGLAWLVWLVVEPLWHPLAWALLLGTLLAPFSLRLSDRLGGNRGLASALTLLGTVVLFVLPALIVAGELSGQAERLHGNLKLPDLADGELSEQIVSEGLDDWLGQFAPHVHLSAARLHGWLVAGLQHLSDRIAASGGMFLKGALGTLGNLLLMVFVLFFVLRDGPELGRHVVRLLPIEPGRRARLRQHLVEVTRAVFLGIGASALVHGVLIGVGWWIAGLPSPLLVAMIAALLALIPVVGSALVWVPGALYLAWHGQHGHALFLAGWSVLLVSTIDHVLRPLLISGRGGLPTLAVFVGVFGGLHAFGFIGLFVGPIVLGVVVALFRYEAELLDAARDG